MTWFIIFGLAFFFAFRARNAAKFVEQNPTHPQAKNAFMLIGLFYLQAAILIGMFPYTMKEFTDNIIVHLAVWIPTGLVALATWAEYKRDHATANSWMRYAFYAVVAGVMLSSFLVPKEDYNFPQAEQQFEQGVEEANPNSFQSYNGRQGSRSGGEYP